MQPALPGFHEDQLWKRKREYLTDVSDCALYCTADKEALEPLQPLKTVDEAIRQSLVVLHSL
jgi:hypothetical protein